MWASNWAGRGRRLQLEDFQRKPPCHHDQSAGRRSRDLAGPMTDRTATPSTGEDCRGPAMTRSGRSLLLAYLTGEWSHQVAVFRDGRVTTPLLVARPFSAQACLEGSATSGDRPHGPHCLATS
jgi:hypothetical protein